MAGGKLNRGDELARQVRVGIVVVVALALLAFAVYQVGRLFDVFSSRYPLITLVESSGGLIEGAPVTLAGQRIGQVDEIRFIPLEEQTGGANILVRLSVNQDVQAQIRGDSDATLRTQGLLGDRFVDIRPGSPEYPALQAGDTLPANPPLDYEEVLQTAANTLTEAQAIIADLQALTGRLASGEGTIGALLADDRLYNEMTGATTELTALLREVNRSDGTMGRLIRDPSLYERLDGALARLDSVGAAMTSGQGTLGRLVQDDSLYYGLLGVVDRADSAVLGLQGFVGGIGDAEGSLSRLIQDPELYDQLLRTVVDLQNLIRDIRDDPRRFRPEVQVDVF